MSRLAAAFRQDLRLQARYGFYYAGAFVTLVWIAILRPLPGELAANLLPVALFFDIAVVGFYFIAGQVFFEKLERTLHALVVSPLRFGEYLAAKLGTLTLLAMAMAAVVALAILGPGPRVLALLPGVAYTSLLGLLLGFIAAAPFRSLTTFLIPSQVVALLMYAPMLHHMGWLKSPLFYLFPSQGALLLLEHAFRPLAPWQLAYAVLYPLAWIGLLAWVARWAFERWIVARQGGA